MDTCHLRNKNIIILLFILLIGLLLLVLNQCGYEKDITDGNFTKPIISVNGNVYETTIDEEGEITEDYTFYGNVQSATKEMIGIPNNELEVSKIIENNIGYKVYISKDKNMIAIFNEQTQRYDYFKKF